MKSVLKFKIRLVNLAGRQTKAPSRDASVRTISNQFHFKNRHPAQQGINPPKL